MTENQMQEQEQIIVNVPYIVYESAQTRLERVNKGLVIALIIAIVLIFASNMAWLYAWNQYDYESGETTQIDVDSQGGGIANYIGNDRDINNGKDYSYNDKVSETDEK